MATFTHATYITPNAEAGTNGKAIFNILQEMSPNWEIIEVTNDTTSKYTVYFRSLGCDTIVYMFEGDSSNIKLYSYIKASGGATTINGETYNSFSNASIPAYISQISIPIQIYGIVEQGVFECLCINYSTNYVYICTAKVKEFCTEEVKVICCTDSQASTTSPYMPRYFYFLVDDTGAYSQTEMLPVYNTTRDNGYLRMHPIFITGEKFFGTLTNPALIYIGVNNDSILSIPMMTEFTVNGVNFVSIGKGYAVRLS